jgi:hypothetical protein
LPLIGGVEVDDDETEDETDEGKGEGGGEEVVTVSVVRVDDWDSDVMGGSAGTGVGVAKLEEVIVEPGLVGGIFNEDGGGEVGPP